MPKNQVNGIIFEEDEDEGRIERPLPRKRAIGDRMVREEFIESEKKGKEYEVG